MIFSNFISVARPVELGKAPEPKAKQVETEQSRPRDWQLDCKYTLSEVQQHSQLDDCWMVIFDKVYNITDFVNEHPGGDFILLEYAGRDATHPFLSSRHGSSAYKMLDKYWIGILVDEELYYSNNSSYCSVYSNLSWRSTPTLEDQSAANSATKPNMSNCTDMTTTTTTHNRAEHDEDDDDDDDRQRDNEDGNCHSLGMNEIRYEW